ncbi:MAG: SLC13 family permease, partial [Bacteroidia bacterium]|nr:SLC13 family permease [Bacteroidia bacterium]
MNFEIAVVATVILLLVVSLFKEWFRPVMAFTMAIILLLITNIISPSEALTGFSNENIAIIFFLLLLSNVFRKTGALNYILNRFLKPTLNTKGFIARMALMVGGLSGFVNNTPLVAIMLPNVYSWANKKGINPSKVLMPLSYVAIVGGMLTLIGTSTNLIINGMAIEQGFEGLDFFAFIKVGAFIMVAVCLYVIFFSDLLLPNRKGAMEDVSEHPREYFVETIIPDDSSHINNTIEEAGLRNLKGLFLVEIIRGDKHITPVLPNELLLANDILLFAGDTETIIDVAKNQKDIRLKELSHYSVLDSTDIVEAVVAP